jgi:hypothetical protein
LGAFLIFGGQLSLPAVSFSGDFFLLSFFFPFPSALSVPLRLTIFVSFTLTVEVKRTKRQVTQYRHIIEAASRVPSLPFTDSQ